MVPNLQLLPMYAVIFSRIFFYFIIYHLGKGLVIIADPFVMTVKYIKDRCAVQNTLCYRVECSDRSMNKIVSRHMYCRMNDIIKNLYIENFTSGRSV